VARAVNSLEWSPNFSLVLPHPSDTPHVSAAPPVNDPVYPKMPPLTPLFLPPPFTPADPIFGHLSSYVQSISDNARGQAQAELDAFMRKKIEESVELDRRLRQEVDLLWASWRSAWQEIVAPVLTPEQRSSNLHGPSLPGISSNGAGHLQASSETQSQSQSRRFRAAISIRDDFELITHSPVTPDASLSTPHTPARSPPAQPTSLLSEARLPSPPSELHNLPEEPSSRSRSPRMLLRRLSSDAKIGSPSASPYDRPHSRSKHRSPSGGRLLVNEAADESRVIAASFQIMMSDTMAPARAAYLARLGLPSTYDVEEEQAREDMSHLTPATSSSKVNSGTQSPKTPKSPGHKKTVSFQATDSSPKRGNKRPSLTPPQRSSESKLKHGPVDLTPQANRICFSCSGNIRTRFECWTTSTSIKRIATFTALRGDGGV
jgi:hypothetical protein